MKKLAIVIPYYKIDFFEDTIKSIAEQTNKNFNLYIGNDNSPINPLPIIKKYLAENEYKYYEYDTNLGGNNLALQWERILNNVDEEWFQILGDDDVISENFVEEFYNNLDEIDKENSNVIKFSICWIDSNTKQTTEFTQHQNLINPIDHWRKKFDGKILSSLSEHIFRRNEWKKFGFKDFPLAYPSDDLAILETSQRSPIFFISSAKVFVRVTEKSISGSNDKETLKDYSMFLYMQYLIKSVNLPNLDKFNILKQYRYLAWKNNFKININLFMEYLKIGYIRKAIGSFKKIQ